MMSKEFLPHFEDSNPRKKHAIECWLLDNVDDTQQTKKRIISFCNSTSFYSTSLPDTRKWQPEFKARVFSAIVDRDMKEDLLKSGLINWCHNVRSVIPVKVPKDGNCLLHAVAVAVWGISDKSLMLRRLLGLALSVNQDHFQRRWVRHRQRQLTQFMDKLLESGVEIMDKEWIEIRQCLEPDRSNAAAIPYRFLESIHVYALANILRRPVIVLTDHTVRTFTGLSLQDNDMGGIYLPLEWDWTDTSRVPILLGYFHCHFCPLLFAEHPNQTLEETALKRDLAPLVNSMFQQFPVRFLLQVEEPDVGLLLRKYLRVKETVMKMNDGVQNVLCAEVEVNSLPAELNLVVDYVEDCGQRFHQDWTSSSAHQLPYNAGLSPSAGAVKQKCLHPSAFSQSQNVRREELQKIHTPEYGLGDPTLHNTGRLRQHHIHIPPPSFTPLRRSFDEQSVSLNPSPEKKCVVPTCRFFGDPDLAMMCSSCFRNYTIRESRKLASGGKMQRPPPTAPLASMPAEEQFEISMMIERCKENCGYRCSTKTYPYCHECAGKRQRQTQKKIMAAAFETAMAPNDPVKSVIQSASDLEPVAMKFTQVPQESREAVENTFFKNQTGAQSTSSVSQSPVRGTISGAAEAGATFPKSTSHHPAEEMLKEALTQIFVTGELSCPLPSSKDPSALLLFGSGQAVSLSSHPGQVASSTDTRPKEASSSGLIAVPQVKQLPSELEAGGAGKNSQQTWSSGSDIQQQQQSLVHDVQNLSSPARMAKGQVNSGVPERAVGETKAMCTSPRCSEQAVYKTLCGKCYVSQGLGKAEAASTVHKMKTIHSTSSSAPASVGPVASIPRSNATYTKEVAAFAVPETKSQPPSLSNLSNIPHMNYVHCWLHENRITQCQGGENAGTLLEPKSPPQGLPEKQESEPLGNDLIASGLECQSSTHRCIGEGCGSAVQEARKLCQQCQEILQHARQGHTLSASVKGKVGEKNQHSSQANTVQSPSLTQTPPYTITVPPEFNYVHTPMERQGQLCTSAGCRLFGDPKQARMCFAHYQQHVTSICQATRLLPATKQRSEVTNIPYVSEVHITPTSATSFTPDDVFPPPQVAVLSVPPCSSPTGLGLSIRSQLPSLGETYNRVAVRQVSKCLNPSCSNYGNHGKGGLCNSCAQDQKVTDDLISRTIYGDEETG